LRGEMNFLFVLRFKLRGKWKEKRGKEVEQESGGSRRDLGGLRVNLGGIWDFWRSQELSGFQCIWMLV
jgi:hypothetical protein